MVKAPAVSESLHSRVVVSRVLYSNVAIGAMTISLDESLPTASSNLPEFQLVRAAPGSLA